MELRTELTNLGCLVFRHQEPREGGIAAGAFAGCFTTAGNRMLIKGQAGSKNPETLLAIGLAVIINEYTSLSAEPPVRLHVFLEKTKGIRRYLNDLVPRWIENDGQNAVGGKPDALGDWKTAYYAVACGSVVIEQRADGVFAKEFARLASVVKSEAGAAYDNRCYRYAGLRERSVVVREW